MRAFLCALGLILLGATPAHAQPAAACTTGTYSMVAANQAGTSLYVCGVGNAWTTIALGGAGVPQGAIIFVASGTCPATYTEVAGLNGKMIRGTVAANANVGTTGGSDTYTPAGTVSALTFTGTAWSAPTVAWPVGVPTFTGSALTTHNHTISGSTAAITAGTPAGAVSALTTGADSSTTGGVAKAIAQTPTFTGSALGTHLHGVGTLVNGAITAGTPAGAVAWPAGVPTIATYTPTGTINTPILTGTQATVVPAYEFLIACSKN